MEGSFVVLCGGVGGSKLADGFARVLPPDRLSIVVNTADDFDHLGMRICPDLDTVTYMLAGLVDPVRGWGRVDETWNFMETLGELGGKDWFRLGDRDLAVHLHRSELLRQNKTLAEITRAICKSFGIEHVVLPMTEGRVATRVVTATETLDFQDYFVRLKCDPVATDVQYAGIDTAKPGAGFLAAISRDDLAGIFIAPSNPILSIGPILALDGVRDVLRSRGVPIVAVSPLIGGAAVKGPAAKLMRELGHSGDSKGILAYYDGLLDGLVLDESDAADAKNLAVVSRCTPTLMRSAEDRARIARSCLEFLSDMTRRGMRGRVADDQPY